MKANLDEKNSKNSKAVSINSWVESYRNDEEMREIFLNMDRAMKYLHERGYCIASFDPRKIHILNNSVNQIKFEDVMPMPKDNFEQKRIVKEDIYNSSFVQVGLYANCLFHLRRDFLKGNFDSFAQFLPEGDVPYYRGVIDRGASVYFCEYSREKVNRDLANLEQELQGEEGAKTMVKSDRPLFDDTGINDHINDAIYKGITGRRDAAYVSFLLYPTIFLIFGVIVSIVAWVLSLL